MDSGLEREFRRLVKNTGDRRTDLLRAGLKKAARRKALNVSAGSLSLLSAGAIATGLTDLLGHKKFEVVALLIAIASGFLSLLLATYFSDEESIRMLNGSSKYLSLREAANRALNDPRTTLEEQYQLLTEYHSQYAKLDEDFSKYLTQDIAIHSCFDPTTGVKRGGSNE